MASTPAPTPFHLAIAVRDLAACRAFYGELLGCPEGRSARSWVDFDFFGNQLVCHRVEEAAPPAAGTGPAAVAPMAVASNPVDGDAVPVPHFGVVLPMERWRALAERFAAGGGEFVIAPRIRFRGEPGEQGTFFVHDPSGHALEFKGFRNSEDLFATTPRSRRLGPAGSQD